MAQIIPFPGIELETRERPQFVTLAPAAAPVAADFPVVRSLKGGRIPKAPRQEDEATAMIARIVASYQRRAEELAQTDPGSEAHRLALHMIGMDHKLPRNNLRCIVSTLDEERDFDLRVAEVEILLAEHALNNLRLTRARCARMAHDPRAETQLAFDRDEANRKWDECWSRLQELAGTPVRTWTQLARKRSLIGKSRLGITGEAGDRFRAGIAADEAWLDANRPKRGRRA